MRDAAGKRVCAPLLVLALALPSLATAQEAVLDLSPSQQAPDVAAARALFDQGLAAAAAADFETAIEAFEGSLTLVEHASTVYDLAACYVERGRHVDAARAYTRYLEIAELEAEPAEALAAARRALATATAHVARLVVHVEPASAVVAVDEVSLGLGAQRTVQLDPGPHVLRVTADGHAPALRTLTLAPGDTTELVTLPPLLAPPELVVRASPVGAEVAVDGGALVPAPLERTLPPGPHHLRVVAPGHEAHELEVALVAGQHLTLELGLTPTPPPLWESPVLWTIVGAVVAGAIAVSVGVAVSSPSGELPASGGSSGVVLTVAR